MFCLRMGMFSFPKSHKKQQHYTVVLAPKLINKSQHDALSWTIDAASAQPREATI